MSERASIQVLSRSIMHDQADGSGPATMTDSRPSSAPASIWGTSSREAMLEEYRRHWKGAWRDTRCLQTLSGHSSYVAAVAVLDADRIVSASDDNTLKVWSLTSGECLQTLSGHTGWVRAVAVLGADRIVSGSSDKTLKVWSLASGECLQTLSGHSSFVHAVAVLDADRIVSGSGDKTLKVWSVTDPRRHMAALQINRYWRDAISNPERKLCREWLARQCE